MEILQLKIFANMKTRVQKEKINIRHRLSHQLETTWFVSNILKLPNVSNKDALSVRKWILCSTINKRNKELQHLSKELSLSENVLSTQLSTTDFYIITKSITSHNTKSLEKSLYTQQKKLSLLAKDWSLPIFTANETITNLTKYELSQEKSDLLKASLYFSIQQIKFENPKFSLSWKRFIVRFLRT